MRSEKGITLVALIGVMLLLVILAGVSIALAVKGGNEDVPTTNTITTVEDDEVIQEDLVVDPYVDTEDKDVVTDDEKTNVVEKNETVENTVVEDNENVVEEDDITTVANEVEQ